MVREPPKNIRKKSFIVTDSLDIILDIKGYVRDQHLRWYTMLLLCDQVIFIQYDCEMPGEHPSGNVKEAIVLVHSQAAKYIRFKY